MVNPMTKTRKIHGPISVPERAAVRDALASLRGGGDLFVEMKRSRHALPAVVAREVEALLEAFAEGQTPWVSMAEEEVGTQQAAEFLNLSRPTVVKMMDEGRIPFRKPGKHRRVRMVDLVAFGQQLTRERDAAADELSALGQNAIRHAQENGSFSDEMI